MLTFNGKEFNSKDFTNSIMENVREMAQEHVAARIRAIRLSCTGEFPTVVVYGNKFKRMSMSIEGSAELLECIRKRLNPDDISSMNFVEKEKVMTPTVFLSFGWEDKELASAIANQLMQNGINTWYAEWEVTAGASLVEKINDGLGNCTHFLVLLTPTSIVKPWVKAEMDAGFVRNMDAKCQFIPIRHQLNLQDLPELLQARYSPQVDAMNFDVKQIINDIHGVSRKPPLGKAPPSLELPQTEYSKAATAVAREFVIQTPSAQSLDCHFTVETLTEKTGLTEDDVIDAIYELDTLLRPEHAEVYANTELFVIFDKYFKDWDPEIDAMRVASDIYNNPNAETEAEVIANSYGWPVRRMNVATAYLFNRNIIRDSQYMGTGAWDQTEVVEAEDGAIRRFVKSRT